MEPVFLDFHIHTSSDPEKPNSGYDLGALKGFYPDTTDG